VRKIILQLSMSLDGYFEGPGRELDWHQVDDELHRHFNEVLAAMSVFIDGRLNYELMAQYWPHADEDPNASAPARSVEGLQLGQERAGLPPGRSDLGTPGGSPVRGGHPSACAGRRSSLCFWP
jgi:RibD C-terminal domain